jgi:cytolysin (calcineurin-like family phosphatase)
MKKPIPRIHIYALVLLSLCFPACESAERPFAFIVVADTHFKGNDSLDYTLGPFVEQINRVQEIALPDSLGGEVPMVRGVVLVGDITQDGKQEEWQAFRKVFGHSGESRLVFPVYEGFGNHDGPVDGPVRMGIRERNSTRQDLTAVSDNGLHYAWKWGGVHFIQLNLYPSDAWDPECGWCHYFHESFREPEESLGFLRSYLADHLSGSGEPLIIFFHYGWDDFSGLWWTESEKDHFYEVVHGHHVLGIFTGHRHVVNHFSWRDLDIWSAGSPAKPEGEQEFLLVLMDSDNMTVLGASGENWTHAWSKSFQSPEH